MARTGEAGNAHSGGCFTPESPQRTTYQQRMHTLLRTRVCGGVGAGLYGLNPVWMVCFMMAHLRRWPRGAAPDARRGPPQDATHAAYEQVTPPRYKYAHLSM